MIIFGWGGGKVKDRGPAVPQTCPSCGLEGFLHYLTVTKWFRLYFIPIIPYSTKYFLACPVCTAGRELTTSAERQSVHALAAATASLNSGLISPDVYAEQIQNALGHASPALALPPTPKIDLPSTPAQSPGTPNRIRAGETWSG